jgi:hypothetical protein
MEKNDFTRVMPDHNGKGPSFSTVRRIIRQYCHGTPIQNSCRVGAVRMMNVNHRPKLCPGCFFSNRSVVMGLITAAIYWTLMRKNDRGVPGVIGMVKFSVPPVPALVWMLVQVAGASAGVACTT